MINDHTQNVLMMLQNSLATTSMTFKDVLELRTQVRQGPIVCISPAELCVLQNMKESKNRTEQFMYTTQTAANNQPASCTLSFYTEYSTSVQFAFDSAIQPKERPYG